MSKYFNNKKKKSTIVKNYDLNKTLSMFLPNSYKLLTTY